MELFKKRGVEMPFQNQVGVLLFFLYEFMVQIYGKLGEERWGERETKAKITIYPNFLFLLLYPRRYLQGIDKFLLLSHSLFCCAIL